MINILSVNQEHKMYKMYKKSIFISEVQNVMLYIINENANDTLLYLSQYCTCFMVDSRKRQCHLNKEIERRDGYQRDVVAFGEVYWP